MSLEAVSGCSLESGGDIIQWATEQRLGLLVPASRRVFNKPNRAGDDVFSKVSMFFP